MRQDHDFIGWRMGLALVLILTFVLGAWTVMGIVVFFILRTLGVIE